jgi:hypothetical protein
MELAKVQIIEVSPCLPGLVYLPGPYAIFLPAAATDCMSSLHIQLFFFNLIMWKNQSNS